MESEVEDAARRDLRARQGAGARYDSAAAPARDLLLARRGTAFFARKLNQLSDAELREQGTAGGWSFGRVVAHVSHHARHLARIAEAARNGTLRESLSLEDGQTEDVLKASTLPPHALRYLFQHSEVHLNVEWRDLAEADWSAEVLALNGARVPVRSTPMLRAREIWRRALELDPRGAASQKLPPDVRDLLAEKPG